MLPGYVKKKFLLITLLHYCFPSGDPAIAWRDCINFGIVLCGMHYLLHVVNGTYVRGRYFDPVLLL